MNAFLGLLYREANGAPARRLLHNPFVNEARLFLLAIEICCLGPVTNLRNRVAASIRFVRLNTEKVLHRV